MTDRHVISKRVKIPDTLQSLAPGMLTISPVVLKQSDIVTVMRQ